MLTWALAAGMALAADTHADLAVGVQLVEFAVPDVRWELRPEAPVEVVLSWPVVPWSGRVAAFDDTWGLLVEPWGEVQVPLTGRGVRGLAGGSVVLSGPIGLVVQGGAVFEGAGPGWMIGVGPSGGPRHRRGARTRVAIQGRMVTVGDDRRYDLCLDFAWPYAGWVWGRIFRGEDIPTSEPMPPPPPPPPVSDRLPYPLPHPLEPFEMPACDPMPCMPGMCGEESDGCGGTQYCGDCPGELEPEQADPG